MVDVVLRMKDTCTKHVIRSFDQIIFILFILYSLFFILIMYCITKPNKDKRAQIQRNEYVMNENFLTNNIKIE